jgi:hypothetical protein
MAIEKKQVSRDSSSGQWLTKQIEQAKTRTTGLDEKRKEVIQLKYKRQPLS